MAASTDKPDIAAVTPINADVHHLFLRGVPPAKAAAVSFDTADSQYAYSAVGHALVIALSEAATQRPNDPIEFVAQRLLNYRDTVEHCRQRDAEVEAYREMKRRQLEEEARQKAIEEELRLQREQEERRRREELDRMRRTVPLETFVLPPAKRQERNKAGATPLHTAVRAAACDVETLLRLLHEGHSFCARDAQGANVRDAALACKNDAVVKEIDSLVVRWIREEKLDYLRWLLAADYGSSFPNLKKAFGPKLKGVPDGSRRIIDAIPQWEARYRELWKLSAKGTKEHLEAHCRQLKEQQHPEDVFSHNREGLSAMHVALLCKNADAAHYLATEHPRLLDLPDNFGRLPIHYAHGAGQNFVDIVRSAGTSGASPADPADAFGFVPAVYAKRYELLPEPPNYGSPDLLVTADADAEDAEGTSKAAAATSGDADAAATDGVSGDAAEAGGGKGDEADQSKLTPINEDEGED